MSAVRTMNSATPRLRVLVAVNVGSEFNASGVDAAHLHWHLFLVVCTDLPVAPNPKSRISLGESYATEWRGKLTELMRVSSASGHALPRASAIVN